MSVVRFRPWAPFTVSNISTNQSLTDILFVLLPNLLPKTWADFGLFIQERLAPVWQGRAVLLACLRIVVGPGGLTVVVIVMVTAQIH